MLETGTRNWYSSILRTKCCRTGHDNGGVSDVMVATATMCAVVVAHLLHIPSHPSMDKSEPRSFTIGNQINNAIGSHDSRNSKMRLTGALHATRHAEYLYPEKERRCRNGSVPNSRATEANTWKQGWYVIGIHKVEDEKRSER